MALTIALVWRAPRMKPSRLRLMGSILASICLFVVAGITALHACNAGQPFMQMLIPSLCMASVLMFVKPSWMRRAVTIVMVVAAFALSQHFSILVHMNGYTGNPHSEARLRVRLLRSMRERIEVLRPEDSTDYPAGWLFDSIPLQRSDFSETEYLDHRAAASATWHTWLTRIYRTDSVPTDVWFSGGRVNDPEARLEVRDRSTD
jgi:hypothetical protein